MGGRGMVARKLLAWVRGAHMSEADERKKRKWHAIDGPYGWVALWAAVVVFAPFTYSAVMHEWGEGRHAGALVSMVTSCSVLVLIATVTRCVAYGRFHAAVGVILLVLALTAIASMALAMMGVVSIRQTARFSILNVYWVDVFCGVVLFGFLPSFFRQFRSVFRKSDERPPDESEE